MGITFNADEILAMAEQIEGNGAAFYRKAAELQPAQGPRDFLLKLAAVEDEHRAAFAAMRARLTPAEREATAYDPDNESALYLATMAEQHPGEGLPAARDALTGKEALADILKIAIELERKSILYYVALKDLIPIRLGRNWIDAIIKEERSHIATLSRALRSPRPA
jgi:rubrerythrin